MGYKKKVARLAQMVERMTLNHVVVGSIPTVGVIFEKANDTLFFHILIYVYIIKMRR